MSYSRLPRRWAILFVLCILAILPACVATKMYYHKESDNKIGASPMFPYVTGGQFTALGVGSIEIGKNTESYANYQDSGFLPVARQPLSTFSIEVDSASYSNVRRFLNDGEAPPKDAVRVAELVNYFNYEYPTPTSGHPVGLAVDGGPCPWNENHRLARIMLKAVSFTAENMPPRNFVFLVDVSGSMNDPQKLPLVKASLRMLVEHLTQRDRVSIVTYAGDTTVLLPATSGSEKRTIIAAIESLDSGGSTNGASGIERAYEQAKAGFISNGVNRVILATDGDFNVGITSQDDLVSLIEKKRDQGIYLSVLGYGMGNLKDSTMQKLAHHGDGHYAYVDSLEEARKLFVEQGGALAVVAKDVKLQVEFNPSKVSAYRLIGYENRILKNEDFKDDKKDAGDLGSGHAVTALYEIVPTGVAIKLKDDVDPLKYQRPVATIPTGSTDYLTVKLRYKQPAGGASKEIAAVLPEKSTASNNDYWFAATVAEFGMLLRDSEYKGTASYKEVLKRAEDLVRMKNDAQREEFVQLVRKAMKNEGWMAIFK